MRRRIQAALAALTMAMVLPLWACDDGGGDDDGTTDGATDTGNDGYPGGLPTIVDGDYVWSGCDDLPPVGSPSDEMVSATFVVEDFEGGFVVEGVQIEVFYTNDASGTPDLDATNLDPTDVDGRVTALVPADRRIAYRVIEGDTPHYPPGHVQTSVEYDQVTPEADGGEIDAISVSQATYTLIPTVLGITPDPAKGILAGAFTDCGGADIEGVVARLYNPGGTRCEGANECLDRYFIDETPAQDQFWSSDDGLFGVLQIPAGDDYHLELHAIVEGSGCPGDMVILGEKDGIQILPNSISIVDMDCTDLDDSPWSERCVW